jgi:hypothetical protein
MDTQAPMPHVDATLHEERLATHRIKPLYRTSQIVWYIIGILEALLALRFLLKLLGANPAAGFTQFIYGATWLFAGPFIYVFRVSQVQSNIVEWSTLLAMAVYFLVGWMIVKALVMAKPVSTEEADQRLPEQEKV